MYQNDAFMIDRALKVWENSLEIQTLLYGALLSAVGLLQIESQILCDRLVKETTPFPVKN